MQSGPLNARVRHAAYGLARDRRDPGGIVDVLRRVEAERGVARGELRRHAGLGGLGQVRRAARVGEARPQAADHLEVLEPPAGRRPRVADRSHRRGVGLAEGMEAMAVADEPPEDERADLDPPEPHPRPVPAEGLGLQVDVVEAIVVARKARRRVAPEHAPGLQVLVEQTAAFAERHAERAVLVSVPAHGWLDHQPALGQQVERGELMGEQQRMAQRRDDRRADHPDARRRRGDGAHQHHAVRPRRGRVLVAGRRVLLGVAHPALGARARPQHDVLGEHHSVDPGVLGLLRDPHDGPQVARVQHGPVLAQDHDQPRPAHVTAAAMSSTTATSSRT